MIKFFRKIRQRTVAPNGINDMIKENRVSKYMLYAIGEIILVVIGILIALQINNWNEERIKHVERQQLISAILEDFEYNRETLNNNGVPAIELALENMSLFFQLMEQETELNQGHLLPSIPVSVDSLRRIAIPFFQSFPYNANLTSLNEASSSGKLSLLKNKDLFKKFTLFEMYHDEYRNLTDEFTSAYYNGCLWEIRKTVAPDVLAGSNAMPELSYTQYKKIMDQPLAQTALYNSQLMSFNKRSIIKDMLKTSEEIISILQEMQQK